MFVASWRFTVRRRLVVGWSCSRDMRGRGSVDGWRTGRRRRGCWVFAISWRFSVNRRLAIRWSRSIIQRHSGSAHRTPSHGAGAARDVRQLSAVSDRSGGIGGAVSGASRQHYPCGANRTQVTYQLPAGSTAAVRPWGMVPVAPTARLPVKVFCVTPSNWQ